MNKSLNLANAAYTDRYRLECEGQLFIFGNQNLVDTLVTDLPYGYRLEENLYVVKTEDNTTYSGREVSVFHNRADNALCTWKCYDDNAIFYDIIKHSDGNEYLLFRQELYGYSVYCLTTDVFFQYYPQSALDGEECFIWAGVEEYRPEENWLLVTGCYWACPWSIAIIDFENPLSIPRFQLDIRSHLAGDYFDFDDIYIDHWEDDVLHLKCLYDEKVLMNQVKPKEWM